MSLSDCCPRPPKSQSTTSKCSARRRIESPCPSLKQAPITVTFSPRLFTQHEGKEKMDFHEVMLERNASFARTEFSPELKIMPSTGTIVVGCVDPRVDPANVLGLKLGEAAVIRNVG